jgi:phenylpropionate dioxygenase-like ring-hydroxylating dioxygenase large terminal subunit
MDNDCSHKGAALSGGFIHNTIEHGSCVSCPYHGYEFAGNGTLVKVPGLTFESSNCKDQRTYPIIEKNGWIYLNTNTKDEYKKTQIHNTTLFEEPEAKNPDFSPIFLNVIFKAYSRVVSENSLDVMHIGFVHTFGNKKNPAPVEEQPPRLVGNHHYKTSYLYEAGDEALSKKVFGEKLLRIENEFILPHTTVARVIFGPYISTVITFALPISETKSKLFVKTYRNFWNNPLGDLVTEKMMFNTMLQDKMVVENIDFASMDGKFNMKFDKLQNTYKSFYKRFIHNNNDAPN